MPMSASFAARLQHRLPELTREFGTPFHIYDEAGIIENGSRLNRLFAPLPDFREYFAVKALPNLWVLSLLQQELGFGFDCSSITELKMVRSLDARGEDIFFSSNNTSASEYAEVLDHGGAILNFDDLSFVDKPGLMPEIVAFRYNPGTEGIGNKVIGSPRDAKFGLRTDQIEEACRRALARGAKRLGLHTMIATNESNVGRLLASVDTLLNLCADLGQNLEIQFDFVNMGGGISIPYRPGETEFDLKRFSLECQMRFKRFRHTHGYAPRFFMECGRFITGAHGVLVTRVINRMSKYREYVGVDASMAALMRPGMYEAAYNHVTVHTPDGTEKRGEGAVVDVVGSLCENNDKFAEQIALPPVSEDDFVILHDTGAHGHSMGFQYNGRLRPKELLLQRSGNVQLIRRAETVEDYLATQIAVER